MGVDLCESMIDLANFTSFSVNIRIANQGSRAFFSIKQEYLKLNFNVLPEQNIVLFSRESLSKEN